MTIHAHAALRRTALALSATVAALALTVAPVHATPPIQGSWTTPPNDFVDPVVCASYGVVVTGTEWDQAHWQINLDPDGSFKEGFVHWQLHVVVHANGKTMYEDDYWTDLVRPDGTVTVLGNWTHEQLGGHVIVHDAGLVRFDSQGDVVDIAGPHPTLSGGGMCPFLLPG